MKSVTELPFNRHVGIEESTQPGCLLELPAGSQYLNHVATVHAGAQLTLAEACSGEFLLRNFQQIPGVIPVVRRVESKFKRPAQGRLIARVTNCQPVVSQIIEDLKRKRRSLVNIQVEVCDENGLATIVGSFEWFLAVAGD